MGYVRSCVPCVVSTDIFAVAEPRIQWIYRWMIADNWEDAMKLTYLCKDHMLRETKGMVSATYTMF